MRIDRLLAVTVMMLNRDRVTARELAEKFEISVRTIYRDLEAIGLAGIPVVSYSGNRGGYGIMDTFRLDRQYLTFDDIISMVSVLRGVNTALENRELDTAIEKITSMVPGGQMEEMEQYFDRIIVDLLPLGYTKRQKAQFKTVHRAVAGQFLLKFNYRNSLGEKTHRTVEPMTLIFKGYAWYLFAFCRLKNDFRLFRLSRMSASEVLDETFKRRSRSYESMWSPSKDRIKTVDLVLKFLPAARVRVEDFFDENQIEYLEDGTLQVKVTFPEDEWVYSTLLSYGEDLEVLAPLHIRQILKEKAEKISLIYKPDIQLSKS